MKIALSVYFWIFSISLMAQEIARIKVYSYDYDYKDCPVFVSLDPISSYLDEEKFTLFEISGDKQTPVNCQLERGYPDRLWFILEGVTGRNKVREFLLRVDEGIKIPYPFKIEKSVGAITLAKDGHSILKYQFGTVFPPDSVDPLYRRSGFIHPLFSPGGEVLSRIQPPDEPHHYGIWGPWTKAHIGNRVVNFWALGAGEGTVRFSGFLSQVEGPVFCGFNALQEHIDFGCKGSDQVALYEVLGVRTWNLKRQVWLIDYTSTLNCPLDSGILLAAYRYGGGIGFRATERWKKDNCTVLTSEGKTRIEADGTNARWCIVEGESGYGRSGILFMSHPANREYPEPMRIWPLDANGGRGDMFFEFCPIRNKDWKIERGTDYCLKYRMLVFDGKLSKDEAEIIWRGFAHPPRVELIKK